MFEESRENTGGVIAGMLRSLEDGHLDIVPSAELKKAELAASPANSSSDEVLEMAGDFNYDGYQVVRREFFAHINEPSVTFNNYKFYVNTACLNRFPQVDYSDASAKPGTAAAEQPAIKTMPAYDPDAEVAGLTLTIPSWMSSIDRTKSMAHLEAISPAARQNLLAALTELEGKIQEMLNAIEVES